MNRKRKKKLKIKKKNFTIFLIIIIVITFLITELCIMVVNKLNNPETEEKTPKKKEKEKKSSELDQLENINEKINYFNTDYIKRYISYKNSNPSLETIQIIKNVNMQLDKTQYEDIIPARNLNTPKVLVNKYYYLEEDYVPKNLETISSMYALNGMQLVKEAKIAFESLSKAASKEDLRIIAMSSYRSYEYQVDLYNRYVKQDGKEKADTYSGRPGHSEHQTGLAVDVYNGKTDYTNFEKTKEFKWMNSHAHEYGFILRFPKDKEPETGYEYESWHYRYVGEEIATYIKENNISFEEYYATIIKNW
ncbi:MAG: M15 family metallopeptidase [Bacilli bacterium]|nr:M15 family metallopeptidase [Bacilli bacterium]